MEDGYLEHLESLRSGVRKAKAQQVAKEVAVKEQQLNGAVAEVEPKEEGKEVPGSQTQDVSLHNFNDYL